VKVREVLHAKYKKGGTIGNADRSAPSSGGVAVIESLKHAESVPLKGWNDSQSVHMVAETMRRILPIAAAYLADP